MLSDGSSVWQVERVADVAARKEVRDPLRQHEVSAALFQHFPVFIVRKFRRRKRLDERGRFLRGFRPRLFLDRFFLEGGRHGHGLRLGLGFFFGPLSCLERLGVGLHGRYGGRVKLDCGFIEHVAKDYECSDDKKREHNHQTHLAFHLPFASCVPRRRVNSEFI